jgi:hypothetical protein
LANGAKRIVPDGERDHKFATDVLNASLILMSILVAVIAVLAVAYKNLQSDPRMAQPVYYSTIGTTAASVAAGVVAFLALLHIRLGAVGANVLAWLFGALILAIVIGTVWVVGVLIA